LRRCTASPRQRKKAELFVQSEFIRRRNTQAVESGIGIVVFAAAVGLVGLFASSPFVTYVGLWSMIPAPVSQIAFSFVSLVVLATLAALLPSPCPSDAFARIIRAIAGMSLFYIVFAGSPAYGGTDATMLLRLKCLEAARWVAMAFGAGAFFRPALALPLIAYVFWLRLESEGLYRLSHDNADISAVGYFGLLLVVNWILFVFANSTIFRRATRDVGEEATGGDSQRYHHVLLLSTAVYLANYFWSGWGKVTLDGPPLAWLFENRTYALIPVAHAVGTAPIAGVAWLPAAAHEVVGRFAILFNGLTLLAELGPIVAVMRYRWLAVSCAALVPFHLLIFALTGIFFWKWAFVDAVLAIVFWRIRETRISGVVAAAAVGVMLLAPTVMPTTRLAWYDTSALNESYLVAVTDDDRELRVPSNYFLSASLTFAQMRFALGMFGRMLPTRVFGTNKSYAEMKAAASCELRVQETTVLQSNELWERFERFVREHHAYILAHVDLAGHILYDVYPHHIWSNPTLYRPFAELDKRRIVAYRFITDYVCVGYDDNRLGRQLLGHDERTIGVR
jgi:hypothetical protein